MAIMTSLVTPPPPPISLLNYQRFNGLSNDLTKLQPAAQAVTVAAATRIKLFSVLLLPILPTKHLPMCMRMTAAAKATPPQRRPLHVHGDTRYRAPKPKGMIMVAHVSMYDIRTCMYACCAGFARVRVHAYTASVRARVAIIRFKHPHTGCHFPLNIAIACTKQCTLAIQ